MKARSRDIDTLVNANGSLVLGTFSGRSFTLSPDPVLRYISCSKQVMLLLWPVRGPREEGHNLPCWITGVLIDISVRAFSARRSAAVRIKVDRGRKDLVVNKSTRLWNEILFRNSLNKRLSTYSREELCFILTTVSVIL